MVLTLTSANGSATAPTGPVSLTDNGTGMAPVMLVNGGATVTLLAPALGNHTLLAGYAGDTNNGPANAQPLVVSVTLRPSTTSLTLSSTALAAGEKLILISVVQASGAHAATGTVTFQAGSTTLGHGADQHSRCGDLDAAARQRVRWLSRRSTPATACMHRRPRPRWPSRWARRTRLPLTATPPNMTLATGEHGVVTLAINSNPNFSDTLALGCAGLPLYATCTFSTDRMALTPGLPQSLTVTVDTGNPLGAGKAAGLLPLGALLALLLGRRRRWHRALALAMVLAMIGLTATGCATQFATIDPRLPAGIASRSSAPAP